MLNLHGSLFALRALVRPGLVVPGIKVDTIARLDFAALKKAGYMGAVFDRDNCLISSSRNLLQVSPHHMTYSNLRSKQDAWTRCKSTFGPNNVLVVSNSAGTSDDPLGIQAESLSHNLGVPVLRHMRKKPACGDEILAYYRRLQERSSASSNPVSQVYQSAPRLDDRPDLNEELNPDLGLITSGPPPPPTVSQTLPTPPTPPRLLVIGDRLATDILLARSLPSPSHHLPIWTTRLWSRPDLPLIRFLEQSLLRAVLWSRNQTFRDGVLETRARGENWLGAEGWISKIRRWVVGAVRRAKVHPEPVPPRTNELAEFVVPVPAKAILPPPLPTSRAGWAWYYSKIGAWYAARGVWIGLVWSGRQLTKGAKKGWRWVVVRVKEARARRAQVSPSVETKS
ncbi:hypothetical protein FRC09_001936 [Ceratobasidium sp. 395]|nr:hypothetical protein FRC09_001936 [Ceratobasidium sp. 395]